MANMRVFLKRMVNETVPAEVLMGSKWSNVFVPMFYTWAEEEPRLASAERGLCLLRGMMVDFHSFLKGLMLVYIGVLGRTCANVMQYQNL